MTVLSFLLCLQFSSDYSLEWPIIVPSLTSWLLKVREARLYEEQATLTKKRVTEWIEPLYLEFIVSQPCGLPYPSILEVCMMDEFCRILENTPAHEELSDDMLLMGKLRLPAFVDEWRKQRDEELLKVMRASKSYSNGSKEVSRNMLLLASTAFRCQECGMVVMYPNVLAHRCLLHSSRGVQLPRPKVSASTCRNTDIVFTSYAFSGIHSSSTRSGRAGEVLQHALFNTSIWTPVKQLAFHESGFLHMEALLELCRLPLSTTMDELKVVDPYVRAKCGCFPSNCMIRWTSIVRVFKFLFRIVADFPPPPFNSPDYHSKLRIVGSPPIQTRYLRSLRRSRKY